LPATRARPSPGRGLPNPVGHEGAMDRAVVLQKGDAIVRTTVRRLRY
jgi:hypothetical protein